MMQLLQNVQARSVPYMKASPRVATRGPNKNLGRQFNCHPNNYYLAIKNPIGIIYTSISGPERFDCHTAQSSPITQTMISVQNNRSGEREAVCTFRSSRP